MTYPFFSLPFWWFAGFGWDALLQRRRLAGPILLLCFCLCLLSAFGAITFTREWNDPYDAPDVDLPIIVGTYLWALLLAAFPAAQWLRPPTRSQPPSGTEPASSA